jgi:hypothetical protein
MTAATARPFRRSYSGTIRVAAVAIQQRALFPRTGGP